MSLDIGPRLSGDIPSSLSLSLQGLHSLLAIGLIGCLCFVGWVTLRAREDVP
ncbi:hypothetical protein BV319_00801 [Pseudomonas syringae pv. actinidiae]|nr:hypothetical protein BV319_00801 [Pseudomonas syringae pv. actinidiae]